MSAILEEVQQASDLTYDLFHRVAIAARYPGSLYHGPFVFADVGAWDSAVIGLIQATLPGWAWKIGTCSVSDDAWLVPDFNSPVHGDRLRKQFGYPEKVPAGSVWDGGVDVDRRPPGNTALALLEAFLVAMEEMQ